jgi:diguanylate cyclase (GGDEF)-like protein/PAS domain S-box-containing protein
VSDREPDLDYRALFLGSPAGMVVTAGDGTIVAVNEGFLLWTGWRREDLLGTRFTALMPIGDRILFSTRTEPQLQLSGRVPEVSLAVTDPSGVVLPAALVASRVTTEPPVTLYTLGPRRARSVDESTVLSAVHHAEASELRREEAEQSLEELARRDPLTGLLNRNGFVAELAELLDDGPDGPPVAVYVLGLDHFRTVTESLGRPAGEEIVTVVATRLERAHPDSILARSNDSELAIARRQADDGTAERLIALVAAPLTVDGLEIVVTASLGVETAHPGLPSRAEVRAEEMTRNAASAMYEAKSAGGNRWKPYVATDKSSAIEDIRMLGEMRAGLSAGRFRLEYQPQLDLVTGLPHGVEALMRWDHPSHGTIAPDRFIAIAESSGLIGRLGAWAVDTAVTDYTRLGMAGGGHPLTMSVNVSARQLGDAGFAATVESLLAERRVHPSRLTVELTESALITDAPQAQRTIDALTGLGVRLSIDDFGTGHAGFRYLKDFPIGEIKIDRSFIRQLGVSDEGTALVVSCIELAHALGVAVVAEGVETPAQLERLTDLGCDIVQGYLYARPMRADDLVPWLASAGAGAGRGRTPAGA